ncbi:MAG TPA: GNAT family N-acetyltransferase [Bacteroidales bacterium]|nr:GNAT family N-acetyltransferase [Bacteroidales bacterium]HPZ36839.1 GNAT family N-acetyltransferase [Bacteroidales bacterium]HQD35236.1 GNAT family N-acetyltransferase [Bacteroidales bacterium]
MTKIVKYSKEEKNNIKLIEDLVNFLFINLENFRDPIQYIENAMNYAFERTNSNGGFVAVAYDDNDVMLGVAVVLYTNMKGVFPENLFAYLAVDKNHRHQGIGSQLMQYVLDNTNGSLSLQVDPKNTARQLYEKFGFDVKYLEMRLYRM